MRKPDKFENWLAFSEYINCLYKSSVSVSSHNFLLDLQFFKFLMPNNFSAAIIRPVFIHFKTDFWQKLKIDQTTCWLCHTTKFFFFGYSFKSKCPSEFASMQYNFGAKCTLTRPVWRIYPFQSWFWQNEECFCTQSHLNRFKILCQKRKKSPWKNHWATKLSSAWISCWPST